MNDASNAKQQIVERIKNATNILVTVSDSPSVDELSAALGLTLLLNKLDKHATAVVSGDIPPAITFLDPAKTFENTIDSLRDFIIALDKEKADHLRYKVEGDVVKIFITPYRTTITSEDLDFSQGDYNVELVLALGVKNQDHLDAALSAHGKILHDATVATLTAGETTSELGSIDWHDDNASSLSEMLVSLSEALKGDKPLLDEQTSTAFLTGIVAATDRFSNTHTSSRVMTMAAQLMAAGANQQLIAAKLQEAHEIGNDAPSATGDGTTELSEDKPTKLTTKAVEAPKEEAPKSDDGSLDVEHDNLEEVSAAVVATQQAQAAKEAEAQLAQQLEKTTAPSPATPTFEQIKQDLTTDAATTPVEPQPLRGAVHSSAWQADSQDEPLMGGTLNATAEEAADDTRRQEEDDRNHTILNHDEARTSIDGTPPAYSSPLNGAQQDQAISIADPFAQSLQTSSEQAPLHTSEPLTLTPPSQTLADLDTQNRVTPAPEDHARAAVEAALNAAPTIPAVNPFAADTLGVPTPSQPAEVTPSLPPMPDFSTLPPLPPLPSFEPSLPQPPAQNNPSPVTPPTLETPTQPPTSDPGQFRIPGQ